MKGLNPMASSFEPAPLTPPLPPSPSLEPTGYSMTMRPSQALLEESQQAVDANSNVARSFHASSAAVDPARSLPTSATPSTAPTPQATTTAPPAPSPAITRLSLPKMTSIPIAPLSSESKKIYSSVQSRIRANGKVDISHFKWGHKALGAYEGRLSKLKSERKDANRSPIKPVRGTFFDLPAEIRNGIYEMLLCPDDGYVELSAMITTEGPTREAARDHHFTKYKKIASNLGILRLNKQINREAAPIFYDNNEFRFTCQRGWFVLHTWLRTIGSANQGLVRKLAVHVPWIGAGNTHGWKETRSDTRTQLRNVQHLLRTMGFQPPRLEAIEHEKCVRRAVQKLEAKGELRSFRLILPDSWAPFSNVQRLIDDALPRWEDHSKKEVSEMKKKLLTFDFVLDKAKFKSLDIQLVRLHGGFARYAQDFQNKFRAECLLYHIPVHKKAQRKGIEVVDICYDNTGNFPVPLQGGDEILEIEEEGLRSHIW